MRLTPDFFGADGTPRYADFGMSVLDEAPEVKYSAMAKTNSATELSPDQLRGVNVALVMAPRVSEASLAGADDLVAVCRFGVGYDNVDVAACTQRDVAVVIAAGAVDRSMAEATVAWMLHLTHNVAQKHALVRSGDWASKSQLMGVELRDRVFGAVGLGGIATEVVRLLAPFGMAPPVAFDPYADPAKAAAMGVRLLPTLDELLACADFVSVHCPLTDKTRGLIGAAELARMKSSAYLINTARGGIVDEVALHDALSAGRIAGAGVDVFAAEPPPAPPAFAALPNAVCAPHCIGWTAELFRDIGRASAGAIVALSRGERPARGVVNPEVFDRPGFIAKWRRVAGPGGEPVGL